MSFEQQKELLCLRMQLEMEKEVTIEKLRQRTELTKLEVETEKLKLIKEGILGEKSRTLYPREHRKLQLLLSRIGCIHTVSCRLDCVMHPLHFSE